MTTFASKEAVMSELEMLRNEIRELKTISLIGQKEVLDIDEASMLTGLSKQTLYSMCRDRAIPHYKSKGGKKSYFKKSELTEWMLDTKVSTAQTIDSTSARKAYLGLN
jgi:excisionase family DNA binding protein